MDQNLLNKLQAHARGELSIDELLIDLELPRYDYDEHSGRLLTLRCEHKWVRSDEPAESCGCPSDPGIHGCHPMICIHCDEISDD